MSWSKRKTGLNNYQKSRRNAYKTAFNMKETPEYGLNALVPKTGIKNTQGFNLAEAQELGLINPEYDISGWSPYKTARKTSAAKTSAAKTGRKNGRSVWKRVKTFFGGRSSTVTPIDETETTVNPSYNKFTRYIPFTDARSAYRANLDFEARKTKAAAELAAAEAEEAEALALEYEFKAEEARKNLQNAEDILVNEMPAIARARATAAANKTRFEDAAAVYRAKSSAELANAKIDVQQKERTAYWAREAARTAAREAEEAGQLSPGFLRNVRATAAAAGRAAGEAGASLRARIAAAEAAAKAAAASPNQARAAALNAMNPRARTVAVRTRRAAAVAEAAAAAAAAQVVEADATVAAARSPRRLARAQARATAARDRATVARANADIVKARADAASPGEAFRARQRTIAAARDRAADLTRIADEREQEKIAAEAIVAGFSAAKTAAEMAAANADIEYTNALVAQNEADFKIMELEDRRNELKAAKEAAEQAAMNAILIKVKSSNMSPAAAKAKVVAIEADATAALAEFEVAEAAKNAAAAEVERVKAANALALRAVLARPSLSAADKLAAARQRQKLYTEAQDALEISRKAADDAAQKAAEKYAEKALAKSSAQRISLERKNKAASIRARIVGPGINLSAAKKKISAARKRAQKAREAMTAFA
jgi:hypothetical protein